MGTLVGTARSFEVTTRPIVCNKLHEVLLTNPEGQTFSVGMVERCGRDWEALTTGLIYGAEGGAACDLARRYLRNVLAYCSCEAVAFWHEDDEERRRFVLGRCVRDIARSHAEDPRDGITLCRS